MTDLSALTAQQLADRVDELATKVDHGFSAALDELQARAEAHERLEAALAVAVRFADGPGLRHWLGSQDVLIDGDVQSAGLIHEALRAALALVTDTASGKRLPTLVEWRVFQQINDEWHIADGFRGKTWEEGMRELAEWREAHPHHSYALVKRTTTQEFTDA